MLKNNIKKKDIIKNLSIKSGFSSNFSKKLINDLIEIIILNIKKDDFNFKDLGKFRLIKKKERLGRNPKTKEEFLITSRKSVSFTVSKKILKFINDYL